MRKCFDKPAWVPGTVCSYTSYTYMHGYRHKTTLIASTVFDPTTAPGPNFGKKCHHWPMEATRKISENMIIQTRTITLVYSPAKLLPGGRLPISVPIYKCQHQLTDAPRKQSRIVLFPGPCASRADRSPVSTGGVRRYGTPALRP